MNCSKYLLCLIPLFVLPALVHAQDEKDQTRIYHELREKSRKHKMTRWIYEALFTDPDRVEAEAPTTTTKNITQNPYLPYKGKIVRSVRIVSLDPFGYSVNDTIGRQPDYIERVGNKYHISTRKRVIRNLLLIEPARPLDPLELSESERLLRLSPYVNDARVYVKESKGKGRKRSDSVDVVVVVQDKWSTTVGSDLDINSPNLKLIEKNLFGIGHQLEEGIAWSNADQYITTSGRYSIFNIKNTFISSSLFYSTTRDNKQIGASLDRPFYSPLAKWAGGVNVTRNYSVFKQTNVETLEETKYPLNYNTQDVWLAKSFPFSENRTASLGQRSSSIIIGARYYHTDFLTRPSFTIDTNLFNRDQTLYLANVGFTRRTYYKERYLYRFGANEDIPQGISLEYVQGLLNREMQPLWYYSGVKLAAGKHIEEFGYLSGGIGYGTFYDKNFIGQGVVNVDGFYFSDLIQSGTWFFRGFTRYKLVHGLDRASYENVNINGTQMYGFSSDVLTAKSKMIVNFEFVMYTPYKVVGFRFAPVILCGFSTMGSRFNDLFSTQVYQSYALGLLIRNEYLIANTFEVSIGLYPYMPGSSDYTVKTNPFNSYNVRARDFFISKPDLVAYE